MSPPAKRRSVNDHASALLETPSSSDIGPIMKEKTTGFRVEETALIARAAPTITQP